MYIDKFNSEERSVILYKLRQHVYEKKNINIII